jgi:hypothetical protein
MRDVAMRRFVVQQAFEAGVTLEVIAAYSGWRQPQTLAREYLDQPIDTSAMDAFVALYMRRQKLRRRWRGVARAAGRLLALQRRAAERAYAPGGAGAHEAAASFAGASHLTATAKSGAQNF